MGKSAVRLEIDSNFVNRKSSPYTVTIGKNEWVVYRELNDSITVLMNGVRKYSYTIDEGTIFIMEDYCFYRHKEFQLLLDSFHIDKVKRVKPDESVKVPLICGVKGLDKSFSVFTDGHINVLDVKNINEGKEHQTQLHTITFDGATWAMVETKNTRFSYRTFYCWEESPHLLLKDLNKSGLGLAKFAS